MAKARRKMRRKLMKKMRKGSLSPTEYDRLMDLDREVNRANRQAAGMGAAGLAAALAIASKTGALGRGKDALGEFLDQRAGVREEKKKLKAQEKELKELREAQGEYEDMLDKEAKLKERADDRAEREKEVELKELRRAQGEYEKMVEKLDKRLERRGGFDPRTGEVVESAKQREKDEQFDREFDRFYSDEELMEEIRKSNEERKKSNEERKERAREQASQIDQVVVDPDPDLSIRADDDDVYATTRTMPADEARDKYYRGWAPDVVDRLEDFDPTTKEFRDSYRSGDSFTDDEYDRYIMMRDATTDKYNPEDWYYYGRRFWPKRSYLLGGFDGGDDFTLGDVPYRQIPREEWMESGPTAKDAWMNPADFPYDIVRGESTQDFSQGPRAPEPRDILGPRPMDLATMIRLGGRGARTAEDMPEFSVEDLFRRGGPRVEDAKGGYTPFLRAMRDRIRRKFR